MSREQTYYQHRCRCPTCTDMPGVIDAIAWNAAVEACVAEVSASAAISGEQAQDVVIALAALKKPQGEKP